MTLVSTTHEPASLSPGQNRTDYTELDPDCRLPKIDGEQCFPYEFSTSVVSDCTGKINKTRVKYSLPQSHENEAKWIHPMPSHQTTTFYLHRTTQSKLSTTDPDFRYGKPRSYHDNVVVPVCWFCYLVVHLMQENWDLIVGDWGCRTLASLLGIVDHLHRVLYAVLRSEEYSEKCENMGVIYVPRRRFVWEQAEFVVR